jgi:probable F420-dependent oxidoreductase
MPKRKYGINLPVSGRNYTGKPVKLSFEVLRDIALTADEYGYETIGVHDHLLNPQGSMPGGNEMPDKFRNDIFEAWTVLSGLSTVTSRARLTNVVLCNLFRSPSVLAKSGATLDVISKGRLNLALGVGWFKSECVAYGIPWKPYRERLAMLRESLQLIKKLWTEDVVNYAGQYYKLRDAVLSPKPQQKPHPPLVVGGSSENVMRLAVEEADGWDVDTGPCSLETFKDRYAKMEAYCKEVGRDMRSVTISVNTTPFHGKSVAEARRLAEVWAGFLGKRPEDVMANKANLLGTTQDIAAGADAWFEAGVNQVNFLMPHDAEYVRAFAESLAKNQ